MMTKISYAKIWRDSIVKFKDISYSDMVSLCMNDSMIFSEKIDGELDALIYTKNKGSRLVTKSGILRHVNTVTDEYNKILSKIGYNSIVIIGELVARDQNKVLPFNQSYSIIQTGDPRLVYHYVYDIIEINGKFQRTRPSFESLQKMFADCKHITIPEFKYGKSKIFKNFFDRVKEKSGEGVIANSYDNTRKLFRIKFVQTCDVVVVGAGLINSKLWNRNEISYLRSSFASQTGNFLISSKIGTGFSVKNRKYFFDMVNRYKIGSIKNEVIVNPKLVIEVKYNRYRKTKVPVLSFKNNKYKEEKNHEGIMMDQASFLRIRNDKNPSYKDTSILQFPS